MAEEELEQTVVELTELVRAMHDAHADQLEVIASTIGALDALTAAYTALAEQFADLQAGTTRPVEDEGAEVVDDSRALREESRQARRQAQSVRERARSLAALASELQGASRRLRGDATP